MIINWSSLISSCYTSRHRHLQSKYDNMCVNEASESQIIADFKELDKMFLGLIDIRQQGQGPAHIRDTKRQFIMRLLHILPPLPPYQILTHNLRGS